MRIALLLMACVTIALAGCETVSAPYVTQMDRVDQKMDAGNRGYLKGTPPAAPDRTGLKRPMIALDIDLAEDASIPFPQTAQPKEAEVTQERAVYEKPAAAEKNPAAKSAEENIK